MKKVLIIFNSGSVSGPEKSVIPALAFFQENFQIDLTVLFLEETRLKSRSISTDYARSKGLKVLTVSVHSKFDIGSMKEIRNIIQSQDFSAIHAQDVKASVYLYLASRGLKLNLFSTFHGFARRGFKDKFYEHLYFKMIKNFKAIFAISSSDFNQIKNMGLHQVKLVENAISSPKFLSREEATTFMVKHFKLDSSRPWIVMPARLSEEKNHLFLIKAIELIDKDIPFTVFCFGQGKLEIELKNEVKKRGLENKILFLGQLDHIEIYLKAFDFFCLVSTSEGLPISLLESIYAELPIIGSKIEGIVNVIENTQNAYLADLSNEKELAHQINKAFAEKQDIINAQVNANLNLIKQKYSLTKWCEIHKAEY